MKTKYILSAIFIGLLAACANEDKPQAGFEGTCTKDGVCTFDATSSEEFKGNPIISYKYVVDGDTKNAVEVAPSASKNIPGDKEDANQNTVENTTYNTNLLGSNKEHKDTHSVKLTVESKHHQFSSIIKDIEETDNIENSGDIRGGITISDTAYSMTKNIRLDIEPGYGDTAILRFGDGEQFELPKHMLNPNIEHTYKKDGDYIAHLEITNKNGEKIVYFNSVTVSENSQDIDGGFDVLEGNTPLTKNFKIDMADVWKPGVDHAEISFGDDTKSIPIPKPGEPYPVIEHKYSDVGNYTVYVNIYDKFNNKLMYTYKRVVDVNIPVQKVEAAISLNNARVLGTNLDDDKADIVFNLAVPDAKDDRYPTSVAFGDVSYKLNKSSEGQNGVTNYTSNVIGYYSFSRIYKGQGDLSILENPTYKTRITWSNGEVTDEDFKLSNKEQFADQFFKAKAEYDLAPGWRLNIYENNWGVYIEMRDSHKNYNKFKFKDITFTYPSLHKVSLNGITEINYSYINDYSEYKTKIVGETAVNDDPEISKYVNTYLNPRNQAKANVTVESKDPTCIFNVCKHENFEVDDVEFVYRGGATTHGPVIGDAFNTKFTNIYYT